jgi:hypothetical protein
MELPPAYMIFMFHTVSYNQHSFELSWKKVLIIGIGIDSID